MRLSLSIALALGVTAASAHMAAQDRSQRGSRQLVVATTTSFHDTGLLDSLVPDFERRSGYRARVVALGSGQSLRLGARGDADVVIAHAPRAEERFMTAGHGARRLVVAWNYFTIVGPAEDPAGAGRASSASQALQRIAASGQRFVSRGDSSGTHQRELVLWLAGGGPRRWPGYIETGQGMAPTLLIADERRAYALTDRATLSALRRRLSLVPLRGRERELLNVYHVIEVRAAGRPRVNAAGARAFADWLTSRAVQDALETFGRARAGEPLFFPARGREPSPGGARLDPTARGELSQTRTQPRVYTMTSPLLGLAVAVAVLTASPLSAQRPSYDRQFLDSTEVFIAPESTAGAYQYVALARVLTPPSLATRNEGQFLVVGGGASYTIGQRVWTRWLWRTRPATAQDAVLGSTAFCLNRQVNGVYQGPTSRDEALNAGWWMTTITDVADLYRQEVRAGEYRLSLDCLRVSAGAPAGSTGPPPTPPVFDAHFLDSAEYFISPEELGEGYHYVAIGRIVIGPTETSRGEAQFLVVGGGANYTIGQRVWTRYYWRTRPATQQDWALGKQVFCLNAEENGVHRGPRDRNEALNTGWWATTITDVSDLYRQEVRAGEYRLALSCLRVVR